MELKDNTVIVVLGASGDLAKKKTVCNRPIYSFGIVLTRAVPRALWAGRSTPPMKLAYPGGQIHEK